MSIKLQVASLVLQAYVTLILILEDKLSDNEIPFVLFASPSTAGSNWTPSLPLNGDLQQLL